MKTFDLLTNKLRCFAVGDSIISRECLDFLSGMPRSSRDKFCAVLLLLLFTMGVGNVWGDVVTFTFTTDAGRTAFSPALPTPTKANTRSELTVDTKYTNSGVSIEVTKGKSSNTPAIFWKQDTSPRDGNTDLRIYREASSGSGLSGNSITISSTNTITALTINGSSLGGLTTSAGTSGGTASAKTWSGSANSITYTNTSTNNIPITSIVVTYTASSTKTLVFFELFGSGSKATQSQSIVGR